jgi:hypothetical protein
MSSDRKHAPKGRKRSAPKTKGKGVSHTARKNARPGGKPARTNPRKRG